MAYHRQQGVDTAIVRIFNTYGPRMRAFDGRAIPTFLRQALLGQPLTVFGNGPQTRSFCYVEDLIAGIWRLAISGEHEPVNIGNPEEFTLLQLAAQVIAATGSESRIVFESLPENDPAQRRPDITRAQNLLGWEPTISLEGGLRLVPRAVVPARADRKDYLRMHRRYLAALVVAAIACGVLPAAASAKLKLGVTSIAIQNRSPTLFYGNVNALKMNVIRTQINWANLASKKPAAPENPNDPAYNWTALDKMVKDAAAWRPLPRARSSTTSGARPSGRAVQGSRHLRARAEDRRLPAVRPCTSRSATTARSSRQARHRQPAAAADHALGDLERTEQRARSGEAGWRDREREPAGAKTYVTLLSTAYGAIHGRGPDGKPKAQVIGGAVGGTHGDRPRDVLHGGHEGRKSWTRLDPSVLPAAEPRSDRRRARQGLPVPALPARQLSRFVSLVKGGADRRSRSGSPSWAGRSRARATWRRHREAAGHLLQAGGHEAAQLPAGAGHGLVHAARRAESRRLAVGPPEHPQPEARSSGSRGAASRASDRRLLRQRQGRRGGRVGTRRSGRRCRWPVGTTSGVSLTRSDILTG